MCPVRVCNIFNSTFLDNVDKFPATITSLTSDNIAHSIRESYFPPQVTEEDLLRITGSIKRKKSTGIGDICPFLIERCVPFKTNLYLKS
jgi:hypothetical protein